MRALWIDAGNDADWAKASAHKMTALYYPVTDPLADVRRRIVETRAHVLTPGLYGVWNWFPTLDGASFAEKVHELATTCTPFGTPAPKVQLDIEAHDPGYILDALRRWRALRPAQDTSWTLESFQGGWMSPAFVAEVIQLKVRVVPQFYGGDMTPFAQDMALRNLIRVGFPEKLVTGFYDAAALPSWWDGFAFSQGTLPA